MERGEKRSYDLMDQPDIYEFSDIEIYNLKMAAGKRPSFRGAENLDDNTKVSALKASSFVVSLVSFTGDSVLSQNCGAIIETDGKINVVITSLNLTRRCDETIGAKVGKNELADNLKVVVYTNDGNWYLGDVYWCDYFYNLVVVKFTSNTIFEPAKFTMIDDASGPVSGFLRAHSNEARGGDSVIVVGRYFFEPNGFMAAPGVLSLDRFRPEKYDCNELLTISSRFTRCGDGAPVISTSGGLIGITFFDIGTASPLLPSNLIKRMWEHLKEHGSMRHPSYGFDAKNVRFSLLSTLEKFQRLFPHVGNGLLVEKVFEDYNAELAGLQVGDVIFSCDGMEIKSFLKLWEFMFAKVGKEVELGVASVDLKVVTKVRLLIGEASIDEEIYRWPRYDYK